MTPYNALAEPFTFPARHMYATETLKTDQQVVDMDMLANSFMRAPGESVGTLRAGVGDRRARRSSSTWTRSS